MTEHRLALRVGKAALMVLALFTAVIGLAVASGRIGIVSTYGFSMNPVYYQGDLVVVARADDYRVGDIAAYRIPAKDVVALHRIIGGDAATGFVFKGDNNASVDPTQPASAGVLGRAVLHLPHAGSWLNALTSPYALAVAAFTLTVVGTAATRTRRRKARRLRRAAMSRHATRPRWTQLMSSVPRAAQATVALAGAVAALAATLGGFSWTTPTHALAGTSTQSTQTMGFSYTASVPLTAAYDDTTVTSPEPVFRRLTDTVDVHLNYQGVPGTIAINAALSTPGGWRATIPLAAPTTFAGSTYDTTITLDLTALEGRADAAAAVTGVAADPVTITVNPTINPTVGAQFAPTLPLQLTPLQLTLTGGPAALAATQTTPVPDTTLISRSLGVGAVRITVDTARDLAITLLTIAILTAGVTLWAVRRMPPISPGARIRRRYAPILASVQPMITPPHLPVVDVSDFKTLAKLAERYGLLVMHWSRSDVDTFLVLDEAAIYRYRCVNHPESHGPDIDSLTDTSAAPGSNNHKPLVIASAAGDE